MEYEVRKELNDLPQILFHPGSFHARVNMATQAPVTVLHCLARKRPSSQQTQAQLYAWPETPSAPGETDAELLRLAADLKKTLAASRVRSAPQQKFVVYDEHNAVVETPTSNPLPELPDVLFGDDALALHPAAPYDVRFPLHFGRLNYAAFPSPVALEDDLAQLWAHILTTELRIPEERFKYYTVVLLVSDLYRPSDLVIFARVLLDVLKFAGVFMLKESVCAAVGAARVPACVVDIGHTRTAVACVGEARSGEGYDVLPGTAFSLKWGGHHVTHSLLRMLRLQRPPSASPKSPFGEHYFPYAAADLHTAQDYVAFHTIKEMHCHLQTKVKTVTHTFAVKCLTQTTTYTFNASKVLRLAPYTLLLPANRHNPPALMTPDSAPCLASGVDPSDAVGLAYLHEYAEWLDSASLVRYVSAAQCARTGPGGRERDGEREPQRRKKEKRKRDSEKRKRRRSSRGEDEEEGAEGDERLSKEERKRLKRERKAEREKKRRDKEERRRAREERKAHEGNDSESVKEALKGEEREEREINVLDGDQAPEVGSSSQSGESEVANALKRDRTNAFGQGEGEAILGHRPAGKKLKMMPVPETVAFEGDAADSGDDNEADAVSEQGSADESEDEEGQGESDMRLPMSVRLVLPPRYLDRGLPVPLAQAIVESLAQIHQSVRAQAAENIVLTGGSSQFAGLQEVLEDKLVELMPRELQKMKVFSGKEIASELSLDAATAQVRHAWHGAQYVEPTTDFIDQATWRRLGPYGALRSRLHFALEHDVTHRVDEL